MSGASKRSMVLGVLRAGAAVFVGSVFRGGDAAPISRAIMSIRPSADGGAAFPQVLGRLPNTGAAPWVAVTSAPLTHSLDFL
jgi:hypothetical protein